MAKTKHSTTYVLIDLSINHAILLRISKATHGVKITRFQKHFGMKITRFQKHFGKKMNQTDQKAIVVRPSMTSIGTTSLALRRKPSFVLREIMMVRFYPSISNLKDNESI